MRKCKTKKPGLKLLREWVILLSESLNRANNIKANPSEELKVVEERFKLETERLAKSWMRYDRATLRGYLVEDVEDPRVNIQSILTRHFLIERLFGKQFEILLY